MFVLCLSRSKRGAHVLPPSPWGCAPPRSPPPRLRAALLTLALPAGVACCPADPRPPPPGLRDAPLTLPRPDCAALPCAPLTLSRLPVLCHLAPSPSPAGRRGRALPPSPFPAPGGCAASLPHPLPLATGVVRQLPYPPSLGCVSP